MTRTNPTVFCLATALSALVLAACPTGSRDDAAVPEPARPIRVEPAAPRAPGGDAIEYTLRFPAAASHYVEVEAMFPTGGADAIELMMPVWTPGSYLVREFSRHVEALAASTADGAPLATTKTAKQRWRVVTGGAERVVVRYRVYGREYSVRTNWITSDIAVLNGAPTFLTLVDGLARPHDVLVELAPGWTHAVTALDPHPDDATGHYLAADYDQLVDSPIALGTPALYEFEVEGVPHLLANFGEGGVFDGARAAADVETIVNAHVAFWGVIPYDRYVFLNVLYGGDGGLEHERSTLMTASPWVTRRRTDYRKWLALVSHEFFHTWNVKRLRPVALGPFDYEREVYTHSLWVAEGITSYYDDLLLARAGLFDDDEYLEALSVNLEETQTTPGRELQSLAAASYDAWIKYYRRDENTDNTAISYYRKGAVVAWLLDVAVRRASRGARSLDDLMRAAYARYSGGAGYTVEQFRAVAAEIAGAPLDEFFARAVDGTTELDCAPALDWFGLAFAEPEAAEDEPAGYLGARLDEAIVTKVPRSSPAFAAGLNADDELIAIDGFRVAPGELDELLKRYRPAAAVELLVARRGRLRTLAVTLGAAPGERWKLQAASRATPAQRQRRADWL